MVVLRLGWHLGTYILTLSVPATTTTHLNKVALRQTSDANTGQVTQVNLVIYDMLMPVWHIAGGGYPQGGWQGSWRASRPFACQQSKCG